MSPEPASIIKQTERKTHRVCVCVCIAFSMWSICVYSHTLWWTRICDATTPTVESHLSRRVRVPNINWSREFVACEITREDDEYVIFIENKMYCTAGCARKCVHTHTCIHSRTHTQTPTHARTRSRKPQSQRWRRPLAYAPINRVQFVGTLNDVRCSMWNSPHSGSLVFGFRFTNYSLTHWYVIDQQYVDDLK